METTKEELTRMLTAKAVTFDIDWAPDFMVEECMKICAKAGVPASFYATHPSPILADISSDPRFELGIHPNFLPQSSHGSTYHDVLKFCLDLVPNASSMRTHSLYQDSRMFAELVTSYSQIRVDASLFLPGHKNLQAVDFHIAGETIRRLPFYWEDDVFAETPGADWSLPPVVTDGLNIFAFHPVHVWINTARMETYSRLKGLEQSVVSWSKTFLMENANQGAGTRTFLESLTALFPKEDFMTITSMAKAS